MTSNQLTQMINQGKHKEALDQMINEGLSVDQIYKRYESINFYTNVETDSYIVKEIEKRDRRNRASKEALRELNSFFRNI